MLRRAAARQLYDALTEAELTAFLLEHPGQYDAIVSADVLIYFGELAPVFAAAAGALRAGGVLVFSLEAAPPDVERFTLAVHGRYSHAQAHVESLLAEAGFRVVEVQAQVLRSELLHPVHGLIFVATT